MTAVTPSRLPIWLIVSLLVNALLIGVLIGGGLGQRKAGPAMAGPGGEDMLVRGIDRAVPDEQRRAVRRAFRRAFADSRQERIQVRNTRQRLAALLAAEDYEASEVQSAFEDLRAAEAAMKARLHDVLAEQLATLSPEQRQAILSDMDRRDRRRRDHDGHRPPPPLE